MNGIPTTRVVVHVEREFDAHAPNKKRCDRLLFYEDTTKNNLVAAPIELKSGKAKESEVVEKLENSLEFAASLVSNTGNFENCLRARSVSRQRNQLDKSEAKETTQFVLSRQESAGADRALW